MLSHRVSGSRIKNTITINTKKTKSNKHKLLIDGGMTLWRRELRTEKGKNPRHMVCLDTAYFDETKKLLLKVL